MGNSQEGEYEDVHDATLGGEVYSSSFSCGGQEIGGGEDEEKGRHFLCVGGEVCSSIYAVNRPPENDATKDETK